jgi:GNAT superfamily N-acetyltransferase
MMQIRIEPAQVDDLGIIKRLCDAHRTELGFVMRPTLEAAIRTREVLVAHDLSAADHRCLGFVHYHHRRDTQTTLYHLAVSADARLRGVGKALILALRDDAQMHGKTVIRLKCPEPLPANAFYARVGFMKTLTEPGKARPLCVWEMQL